MQSREIYTAIFKNLHVDERIHDEMAAFFCDDRRELKARDVLALLSTVGTTHPDHKATQIIAEALKVNKTIVKLTFVSNLVYLFIDDESAQWLADMLVINKTLQEIDLNYNQINSDAAKILANGIKHNRGLEKINLASNYITAGGFKALAEMLEVNRTLKCIDLGNQYPYDEGAASLVEALNNNNDIATIYLWCSTLGSQGLRLLLESFDGKPIEYLIKQASMLSGLKSAGRRTGYVNRHDASSEGVDALSLTKKVELWNEKVSYYNQVFFKDCPVAFKAFPPSLLDITTDYIRTNIKKWPGADLKILPLELQERLIRLPKELEVALRAFTNIWNNHLKADFIKYLSDNQDAYSHAALGVYFAGINDFENAHNHLALATQNEPRALEEFLAEAKYFGLVHPKIEDDLQVYLSAQCERMVL